MKHVQIQLSSLLFMVSMLACGPQLEGELSSRAPADTSSPFTSTPGTGPGIAAPPQAVIAGAALDSDGDGLIDAADTNGDGAADVLGRGIDQDGDGVTDGLDTNGDGVIDVSFEQPSMSGGSIPMPGGGATGGGAAGGGAAGGGAAGGGAAGGGAAEPVPPVVAAPSPPGENCTADVHFGLGEIRLVNNQWTTVDLPGADIDQCIFINDDRSFGWRWRRGSTGAQNPNYPEAEFGMSPWGGESSTTLLPLQLKDFDSASMTLDIGVDIQADTGWNLAFELWLSEGYPGDPGSHVHTEIMAFYGWNPGYWPDPPNDRAKNAGAVQIVNDGYNNYVLHDWAPDWGGSEDPWEYFQFRLQGGNGRGFQGTLDIQALLDYLKNDRGFSGDLWVTRFEIGNEIYDGSHGSSTLRTLEFEVNGETRSAQ